jgi:hypothetical protein
MTTKTQYAQQCRLENPEMFVTENGEIRKLTKTEYDKAVTDWAQMRYYQDNPDKQPIEPVTGE